MSKDNEYDVFADFGVDRARLGPRADEIGAQLTAMRRAVEAEVHRREGQDYWAEPFDGPIEVSVAPSAELDPLVLTVELASPPSKAAVEAITGWLQAVGREESTDEMDHISYWSEASPVLAASGRPAVRWWLDAANASKGTVRRIIHETQRYVAESPLPAVRIVVG